LGFWVNVNLEKIFANNGKSWGKKGHNLVKTPGQLAAKSSNLQA
jgi:hypothetical protein